MGDTGWLGLLRSAVVCAVGLRAAFCGGDQLDQPAKAAIATSGEGSAQGHVVASQLHRSTGPQHDRSTAPLVRVLVD